MIAEVDPNFYVRTTVERENAREGFYQTCQLVAETVYSRCCELLRILPGQLSHSVGSDKRIGWEGK